MEEKTQGGSKEEGTADCTRRYLYRSFLLSKDFKQVDAEEANEKLIAYLETFPNPPSREKILIFVKNWKAKWAKCGRRAENLEKNHKEWLDQPIVEKLDPIVGVPDLVSTLKRKPLAYFVDLSESQKRRRTSDLRQEESDPLLFATRSVLLKEGKLEAAKLLKKCFLSPGRPAKCLQILDDNRSTNVTPLSSDEALSIIIDAALSRHQYNLIRMSSKSRGSDIYPSYNHLILTAKKRCYPHNITVSEKEAVVDLQSLLDHTSYRLVQTLPSNIASGTYTVFFKWGFDGSGSNSTYKQLFEDQTASDASVLCTTLVPVRMVAQNGDVIWNNQHASSTRYCRPIRMAFEKETKETTEKEHKRMAEEIEKLTRTVCLLDDTEVSINHHLLLTMIDGKIVNAITNTKATQTCPICKCTPIKMNDLDNLDAVLKPDQRDMLQYGISVLHARIHFMEFLVHLSYRLTLPDKVKKKGSRLSEEEKEMMNTRKKFIQNRLKTEMGLLVDVPKSGFGTTNDGNTSRFFFSKPEEAARVLEIDESIVKRFNNVLIAISQTAFLNADAFNNYCRDTVRELVSKYPWYTMTPTVHKVLVHGGEFVRYSLLPLGLLSEEAQESRNKDFRSYREKFARKMSRKDNLEDVFHRFLLSSDPLISHYSKKDAIKKTDPLPPEVESLLDKSRMVSLDEEVYVEYQDPDEDMFI